MATIMTETHHGKTRRCDASCHNAKGQQCTCICGGRYHGAAKDGTLEDKIRDRQEELVGPIFEKAGQQLDGRDRAKIRLRGILRTGQVWLNGEPLPLEPSLRLRNHSPTGFSWGYLGSGPSQLALAVMLAIYGPERAQECYMRFKEEFIAKLPQADFDLELDLS